LFKPPLKVRTTADTNYNSKLLRTQSTCVHIYCKATYQHSGCSAVARVSDSQRYIQILCCQFEYGIVCNLICWFYRKTSDNRLTFLSSDFCNTVIWQWTSPISSWQMKKLTTQIAA